jgi:hypothetical protein
MWVCTGIGIRCNVLFGEFLIFSEYEEELFGDVFLVDHGFAHVHSIARLYYVQPTVVHAHISTKC